MNGLTGKPVLINLLTPKLGAKVVDLMVKDNARVKADREKKATQEDLSVKPSAAE